MFLELDVGYCKLITDGSVRLVRTQLELVQVHMCKLRLSYCSLRSDSTFLASAKPYISLDAPKPFPTSTKNGLSPPESSSCYQLVFKESDQARQYIPDVWLPILPTRLPRPFTS